MRPKLHLPIALLGLAVLPAQAAPIIWTTHNITNDVTNVSTAGTVVPDGARSGSTTDRTVNGVTFESIANSGNLFGSLFANDTISSRAWGSVVTIAAYQNLLGQGQRSGRSSGGIITKTADWATVNFTGLTVGNTYQIQIWYSDNAGTTQNTVLVLGDGVTTGSPVFGTDAQVFQEVTSGGAGQYAIGLFVADATTQSFNVRTRTNLTTTSAWTSQDHFSNGWQIRDLGQDASAPAPNPMTWASVPTAVTESTITMIATTATDQTGVEYYFDETSGNPGGNDSGWQSSPTYTDTGLSDNTQYTYTVMARDKTPSQHATAASSPESATTPALDNTPPSPSPMTWASVPAALGYSSITMTATTATDPSGVEYFFDETSGSPGGTDSGWQDSPTYTDNGLDPNTTYSYTVTARDKSGAQNATAPSSPAAPATTDLMGTATINWSAFNITNDVTNVSTSGTLISARNGATSSRTVNGVTFESIANSGNLYDSLYSNDSIGARGYGSVVTNADYQGFLSLGQRSGRLGFNSTPQTEPTQAWSTVEFTGLTIGNTYQIQLWASDVSLAASLDGLAQTKALVLGNGSASGPNELSDTFLYYEMTDGGAGQYGIGAFVANAPNQAFNVRTRQSLNTTPGWANSDHFSNGWQLRDLGASGPDIAAPTPNPMTWASVPDAVSASAITMTATTATDPSGVEYQFTRYAADGTTLLFTSPWQDGTTYVDTGLVSNTTYTYTVTARDKATIPNAGNPSTPKASATTDPVVVVGPVSAANSTVTASPASVLANGIATSTITVTLKDSNGVLISGEGVTLAGSPAGSTITPAGAQTSNASGQAAFTVKSNTIGTVTFTATSVTNPTVITQTANVVFVDPSTATAYNVNFLDEGQANVTGLVGVVGNPGETWNQGTGYSSGAINNLVDVTGANVSTVSVSGLGDDGRTFAGAGLSVFNGSRGFFGKGQNTTISITGLTPNTPFDLYIYSLGSSGSWGDAANTERAAGSFVTTNTVNGNGKSQWLDNGKAGTNDTVFLINGNYVVFQSIVSNGSGNISIVVDAYDGIDGISGTGDGDCRLQVNALQIRPASGMSVDYTAWRNASYPGIGLPDADDDGDGLSNEYEHIFGLNPTSSASSSPYPTPLDPGTGYFTYSRRTQSMINMIYQVRYSTDLVQWFVDNAASQTPVSTSNNVEIMGVDIDPALLSQPKLFMQVRATPITQLNVEPSLVNLWGSGNTITLLFSEPMNSSSATNPHNYAVTQDGVGALSVTTATLNPGGGSVTLTLGSSLGLNTGYTVNLDRVTSSTGQSLGSGVSRQFRTWDNNPNGIKVFILAGQSNMVGYGSVETGNGSVAGAIGSLRYMAVNDASYPDYNYASLLTNPSNTASPFRTRSDVKVWWRNGASGNLGGAISKGDLGPPYQGAQTDKIGPEFAFGHILGDHYAGANEDVLIIKCAWGGRDLAEKFRPPSAVAKRGGVVGTFYNAIIEQTREVLNNLDTQFPEWSGRGYEIVGFAWHQGYNDRLSTAFSAEYKDNLPDLISDVRNVFNKPNMPFAIATAGMAIGAAEAPPYTGYSAVEKAQLWVSGVAQPANVLSTDTRPFWRDAAVSPASQGHHWNWSAESYFLIGKSLGDHMVDLLTP